MLITDRLTDEFFKTFLELLQILLLECQPCCKHMPAKALQEVGA